MATLRSSRLLAQAVALPATAYRERGQWRMAFERFLEHRLAVAGIIVLALLALLSAFAPLVSPYNPEKTNLLLIFESPSPSHPMGTDSLGRDLATRIRDIIARHILPNSLAPIIVAATLGVAGAIITESTLSFLGLGIQPPTPSWGNMLKDATSEMNQAPWTAIFPGLFIFLAVVSINFIGDGLRDALDPRHVTKRI